MTIQELLSQLCEHCGLSVDDVQISVEKKDERTSVQLDVPKEESGILIGYHGETLASIQRLIRIIFQDDEDTRIMLNINNYREQREEKLREITHSAAQRVLDTGRDYTFHSYFPSHERFVIHSTLSEEPDFAELESFSDGNGRHRKLTIGFRQDGGGDDVVDDRDVDESVVSEVVEDESGEGDD